MDHVPVRPLPLRKSMRISLLKDLEYFQFLKSQQWLCMQVAWFWWLSSTFRKESNSRVCWSVSKCMRRTILQDWQRWADHLPLSFAIGGLSIPLPMCQSRNFRLLWTRRDGVGSPWGTEGMIGWSSSLLLPMGLKNSILLKIMLLDHRD